MSKLTALAACGTMPERSNLNFFQHVGAPPVSPADMFLQRNSEIEAEQLLEVFNKTLTAYQKARAALPDDRARLALTEPKAVLQ